MNRFDPQKHVVVIRHKDTGKHDYVTLEELKADMGGVTVAEPDKELAQALLQMAEKVNAMELARVADQRRIADLDAMVRDILAVAVQTQRRA